MLNTASSNVFVGRQPIYDRSLNVMAYELLFRSGSENRATFEDPDVATSQLLINAVVEIGLDNLVFGRRAFVNFTRKFILGEHEIPFNPNELVIEILETVEPDAQVIQAIRNLKETGYMIAIDDFVESDNRRQMLELADVLKIELRGYDKNALRRDVAEFRKFPLKLLAEKVETQEEFAFCKELGFDYFQGYFLSRPQVVAGKTISNNQLAILQLLAKLRDPSVKFDEVVELIKRDVALSLKLLRYVNSLAHGVRHQIDSVKQAAVRLGLKSICQIVSLIAVSSISSKPKPLLETALIRARMCETLGTKIRSENPDICFTIGLFSSLDAFLDQPLAEILKELPVSAEIREALLSNEGPNGRLLKSVIAFERGDWETTRMLGVDNQTLQEAYLTAVAWGTAEAKAA